MLAIFIPLLNKILLNSIKRQIITMHYILIKVNGCVFKFTINTFFTCRNSTSTLVVDFRRYYGSYYMHEICFNHVYSHVGLNKFGILVSFYFQF